MADATAWSAFSELVAPTTLTKGTTVSRYVWDLTGVLSGCLSIRAAMLGTTVPANGIDIIVRPLAGADGDADSQGLGTCFRTVYLPSGTIATTNVAAGDGVDGESHIHVDSVSNFAAGDKIVIYDTSYVRIEFHDVASAPTGIINTLAPLIYNHTDAQSDIVTDNAAGWFVHVPGGRRYEIIASYADDATGSDAMWQVMGQTEDYS